MSPTAVIWDVGGTLVQRKYPLEESRNRALRQVGLEPQQLRPAAVEEALQQFNALLPTWRTVREERRGMHRLARLLLDGVPADQEAVQRFGEALHHYFDAYAPLAGVRALLADLDAAGVRQGVISNWPPSLRELLAHHGLDGYFEVIVVSGEEGIEKPDRRIFATALAEMKLRPRDAVYVGNHLENDIIPARELGMHAVHFAPGARRGSAEVQDAPALKERLRELLQAEDV